MAFIDTDAILTRVREVCEASSPIVGRNVPSGRFFGQFGIDEDRATHALRALVRPVYDVRIESIEAHPNQPPMLGTLLLYKLVIEIKVVRKFETIHMLSDSLRDDVLALSIQDGDVLSQAFQVYSVMSETSGGTSTGIISGMLRHESTDVGELSITPGKEPYFIETVHRYSCAVQVTQTSIG